VRLGTTSYIYPADVITNIRKLAGRVDDIELVIFEADREDNLPDRETLDELIRIGSDHNMTYTVHLPLDLGFAHEAPSVDKAIRVIRKTQALSPHGFIVHLDGRSPGDKIDAMRWLENSLSSLEILSREVCELEKLCVENLENHHPEMIDSILEKTGVSCCVDVGHLWKQGVDPLPSLTRWMSRTRVVHIHGVGKRDHKRLSLMTDDKLDPVVKFLRGNFDGVLTFEIFNERDLVDSMETFHRSLGRIVVS
jgi:sugar phosphate isomerase/epimerase